MRTEILDERSERKKYQARSTKYEDVGCLWLKNVDFQFEGTLKP